MKLSRAAALLGGGALLTAVAALVRWAAATVQDDLRGPLEVTAVGSEVATALLPAAAAAVAALGAVLATRGVLRRAVGLLITLLALAIGWLAVRGLTHDPVEILLANTPTAVAQSVRISPIGPILAIMGALCLIGAGVPVLSGRIVARSLGARYERRGTATDTTASSADPALMMWKELDEQRDPTLGPAPRHAHVRLDGAPDEDEPDGRAAR